MNAAHPHVPDQTRQTVMATIARIVNLKWRGIKADEVPVLFMQDRIAVVLPAEKFTEDHQIRLDGKFQHLMTQQGAHAFLDFSATWKGLDTRIGGGFH